MTKRTDKLVEAVAALHDQAERLVKELEEFTLLAMDIGYETGEAVFVHGITRDDAIDAMVDAVTKMKEQVGK